MIVNKESVQSFFVGLKTLFQGALDGYQPDWNKIASEVPSTTAEEHYGWLGEVAGIREWIGERIVHRLKAHGYTIRNIDYEKTIAVRKNDLEDNNLVAYNIGARSMGDDVAQFPDQQCFSLLKNAFATECYDGQNFIDTDHPVLDVAGNVTSVSNHGGGAGTAWFLMATGRFLKPLIYQNRQSFEFVSKMAMTDDNVFFNKEYLFGVDGRSNVGFSLWQLVYGSKQTLDKTNLEAAIAAMRNMIGDGGRKLNIRPTLLVVPPSLRGAANDLVATEKLAGGASNTLFKVVDVLDSPWLEA